MKKFIIIITLAFIVITYILLLIWAVKPSTIENYDNKMIQVDSTKNTLWGFKEGCSISFGSLTFSNAIISKTSITNTPYAITFSASNEIVEDFKLVCQNKPSMRPFESPSLPDRYLGIKNRYIDTNDNKIYILDYDKITITTSELTELHTKEENEFKLNIFYEQGMAQSKKIENAINNWAF